jgi:uncharacterized protein YukE
MSGDNLDDTYHAMQHFRQLLAQFNDSLKGSVAELEVQHDKVSPLWQDQWRKEYDAIWGPFEEMMKRYISTEGPNYLEFLAIKSAAMRRYLFGS